MYFRTLIVTVMFAALASTTQAQTLTDYGDNRVLVHDVQERLRVGGYNPGPLDGDLGPRTVRALESFAADNGLTGAPLADQLLKLGIDLKALEGLNPRIDDPTNSVFFDIPGNGLEAHRFWYDWKSFDIGRYRLEGNEEIFTLGLNYCNRFETDEFHDCNTDRARAQVGHWYGAVDGSHEFYSFALFLERTVPITGGRALAFADLQQRTGVNYINPQTGERVTRSQKFQFVIENGTLVAVDNALLDEALNVGPRQIAAAVPLIGLKWYEIAVEVLWSTEADGLFRLWIDGKPLWERRGRNTACVPSPKCGYSFKYGPYIAGVKSHFEAASKSDDAIVLRFRDMKRLVGDAASTAAQALPTNFRAVTHGKAGPDVRVRFSTLEQYAYTWEDNKKVDSILETYDTEGRPGRNHAIFKVEATFVDGERNRLRLSTLAALTPEEADRLAKACGVNAIAWYAEPNAAIWLVPEDDGSYAIPGLECTLANTTGEVRQTTALVANNLTAIIKDMETAGSLEWVRNNNFRAWLKSVATGEVVID